MRTYYCHFPELMQFLFLVLLLLYALDKGSSYPSSKKLLSTKVHIWSQSRVGDHQVTIPTDTPTTVQVLYLRERKLSTERWGRGIQRSEEPEDQASAEDVTEKSHPENLNNVAA